MQVVKSVFVLFAIVFPFVKAVASNLKDSVSFGVSTYNDNADVNVYSPTFELLKTVSKHWLVGLKMRVDAITAASIRNGGSPVVSDAVIGASAKEGFDEIRYAPTLLVSYDDGENAATGGIYYSKENDYEGKSFFFHYTRQLNEQNTAVGIGISQSDDTWKPVIDRNLPKDYRQEGKVDVFVSQLLSPRASLQFVYSYLVSRGFLSSPYHYVIEEKIAKFENYPDSRKGHAFACKGVYLVNTKNSLNYGYRYYVDDWKIDSHTLDIQWWHDVLSTLSVSLRTRYYTQSKASFAKKVGTYTLEDDYFAVDYRMSAFDAYDVGCAMIYRPSLASSWKYSASIDGYTTSTNEYIKNWYDTQKITAVYTTFSVEYDF